MEPDRTYFTLDIAIHRQGETYLLELTHTDPGSQAQVAPLRGEAVIDVPALKLLQLKHDEYGKALASQLFAQTEVKQRFSQVESAVQAAGGWLRLVQLLDPSAQELQALR